MSDLDADEDAGGILMDSRHHSSEENTDAPRNSSSGADGSSEEDGCVTSARIMEASIKLMELAKLDSSSKKRNNFRKRKIPPRKYSSRSTTTSDFSDSASDAIASTDDNTKIKEVQETLQTEPGVVPLSERNATGKSNRSNKTDKVKGLTKKKQPVLRDAATETMSDYVIEEKVESGKKIIYFSDNIHPVRVQILGNLKGISTELVNVSATGLAPVEAVHDEVVANNIKEDKIEKEKSSASKNIIGNTEGKSSEYDKSYKQVKQYYTVNRPITTEASLTCLSDVSDSARLTISQKFSTNNETAVSDISFKSKSDVVKTNITASSDEVCTVKVDNINVGKVPKNQKEKYSKGKGSNIQKNKTIESKNANEGRRDKTDTKKDEIDKKSPSDKLSISYKKDKPLEYKKETEPTEVFSTGLDEVSVSINTATSQSVSKNNDTAISDNRSKVEGVADKLKSGAIDASFKLSTSNKVAYAGKLDSDNITDKALNKRKEKSSKVKGKKIQTNKTNDSKNAEDSTHDKTDAREGVIGKKSPFDKSGVSHKSTTHDNALNSGKRSSSIKESTTDFGEKFASVNTASQNVSTNKDPSVSAINFESKSVVETTNTTGIKFTNPHDVVTSDKIVADNVSGGKGTKTQKEKCPKGKEKTVQNIISNSSKNIVKDTCETIMSKEGMTGKKSTKAKSGVSDIITIAMINSGIELSPIETSTTCSDEVPTSENTAIAQISASSTQESGTKPKTGILDTLNKKKKSKKTKKSKASKKSVGGNDKITTADVENVKTSSKKKRLNGKRRAAARRAAADLAAVAVNVANSENNAANNLVSLGGILSSSSYIPNISRRILTSTKSTSTTYEDSSVDYRERAKLYSPGNSTNIIRVKLPTIPEISTEQSTPNATTNESPAPNEPSTSQVLASSSTGLAESDMMNNSDSNADGEPIIKYKCNSNPLCRIDNIRNYLPYREKNAISHINPKNLPATLSPIFETPNTSLPTAAASTSSSLFGDISTTSTKTALKRKAPSEETSSSRLDTFKANREIDVNTDSNISTSIVKAASEISLPDVVKTKKTIVKRRVSGAEKKTTVNDGLTDVKTGNILDTVNLPEAAIATNNDGNNYNLTFYNNEGALDIPIDNCNSEFSMLSDIVPSIGIDGEDNIALYEETVFDKNTSFDEVNINIANENMVSPVESKTGAEIFTTNIESGGLINLTTSNSVDTKKDFNPTAILGIIHYAPSGSANATLPTESANTRNMFKYRKTTLSSHSSITTGKSLAALDGTVSKNDDSFMNPTTVLETDVTNVLKKEKIEDTRTAVSVKSIPEINERASTSEPTADYDTLYELHDEPKKTDHMNTTLDYAIPSTSKCDTFDDVTTSGSAFVAKSESASEVDLLKKRKALKKRIAARKRAAARKLMAELEVPRDGESKEQDNKGDDLLPELPDNLDLK